MAEPQWHPIVTAVEDPVGVWTLRFQVGDALVPYAVVRLIRHGPEVGYRAEAAPSGVVLSYWRTLLDAARAAHTAWIAAATHAVKGGPSGVLQGARPGGAPEIVSESGV